MLIRTSSLRFESGPSSRQRSESGQVTMPKIESGPGSRQIWKWSGFPPMLMKVEPLLLEIAINQSINLFICSWTLLVQDASFICWNILYYGVSSSRFPHPIKSICKEKITILLGHHLTRKLDNLHRSWFKGNTFFNWRGSLGQKYSYIFIQSTQNINLVIVGSYVYCTTWSSEYLKLCETALK